jgi:hypothetical protein
VIGRNVVGYDEFKGAKFLAGNTVDGRSRYFSPLTLPLYHGVLPSLSGAWASPIIARLCHKRGVEGRARAHSLDMA